MTFHKSLKQSMPHQLQLGFEHLMKKAFLGTVIIMKHGMRYSCPPRYGYGFGAGISLGQELSFGGPQYGFLPVGFLVFHSQHAMDANHS